MARPIVGVFADHMAAERAIADLRDAGFDTNRMGLLMKNREEAKQVSNDTGVHTVEGAVTGGVIGGAIGALLAATGTFIIPGIGPFISGGILATAIAGGAVGVIAGGLVGLGIPHEEAQYYENRVRTGSVLVTVDTQGREIEAREILLRNGAEDTWRTSPWNTSETRTDTLPESRTDTLPENRTDMTPTDTTPTDTTPYVP